MRHLSLCVNINYCVIFHVAVFLEYAHLLPRGVTRVCPTGRWWLQSFGKRLWAGLCAGAALPGEDSPGSWIVDYAPLCYKILQGSEFKDAKGLQ